MKINLIALAFMLLNVSSQAQTALQWSDSIVVATTSFAITAPRVTLLADGTPLVTWGTSSNPASIWCSRLENNVFSTPVSVVQAPSVPSLFGFGGYDVAVSDSQVFIVFEQFTVGIQIVRSDDGGQTFGAPTSVQGGVPGGAATLSSVVVDGTGNPVVSYILDKNGATYQVRRSMDGGLSFGEPVTANAPAPGGVVCECCTSDLLASGDSVWIVFRNNNQNLRDIWVSRSIDLAATFDVATDVDATDWMLNACPISGPRMIRAGDTLLLAWMSRASGNGRVYLSTLHAGTMQAGQQLAFLPQVPQNSQAFADITAHGDTIGLVLVEKSREIVCYYSTGGTSGLPNKNTRLAVANHTLQYPSLAFFQGAFHLVYVDATSDKVLYRKGTLAQSSASSEPLVDAAMIFPNPANGAVTIQTNGPAIMDLTLQDAQGRVIHLPENVQAPRNKMKIDLQSRPSGLYFISFRTKDGWKWGKIIKR